MVSGPLASLPPTPPSELAISTVVDPAISDATNHAPNIAYKHIWIISGPAGCGKTSAAEYLHEALTFPFLEGDTFHTQENIAKMSTGQPLTDTDRWDWLVLLREEALRALKASSSGVVVTCSALKRKYRDVFRVASYHDSSIKVHFIFLNANVGSLMDRVRLRTNHFVKDNMVATQIECLEMPQIDELDVLSVDASGTSKEVQQLALAVVKYKLRSNDSTEG